ncbi:MAG: thioredoxin domain-containing protein, partial [Planctomycetota bacterium]
MNPDGTPKYTNRLANATSPYLLQHAHNPVDWYEWGEEALERARREDKPIFLSIGYSSCHWCHVMAHESFENEAIAKILNEHFVCIKVDREERPDIDAIYMQATMIMNRGNGGWPMSVWLTPELKPFFAGTYFPPEPRYGRPGFGELCKRIAEVWEKNREGIESDASRLTEMVDQSLRGVQAGPGEIDLAFIDAAADRLAQRFDEQYGGISGGGTNKFPPSMTLELFLRSIHRRGKDDPAAAHLQKLVDITLDEMSRGGIYDQLGGGIHRYSTDRQWLVPHFEKMLYDQALVSRIYVDAWQATGNSTYRRVAEDIFDYVLKDLQSEQGGFYSTRDADSEGVEGKYYVWTRDEVFTILGSQDAELFCKFYDVSPAGNWDDPHDPGASKSVLHVPRDAATFAKEEGLDQAELERRLAVARKKMLAARSMRVPPHRDEKILVEWNGLMIAALARGGALFGEPKYVEAAARAAGFVLEHQYADGRLMRAYRDGHKLETAFLTDYANLIFGLLELYEATFDRRWFDAAVKLNDATIEHFWDDEHGGFYFTPDDGEKLITRARDVRDGATPSGNS